jgi:putative multiple sugar transport system ATP-binding protein
MISSEMPELLGMCDRIYVMNEGRIVGEMPAGRGQPGKDHAHDHARREAAREGMAIQPNGGNRRRTARAPSQEGNCANTGMLLALIAIMVFFQS